ncbi:MAG: hypothetical protein IEMM0008_1342 [bacterium]|nr:MAG: hypothetical protein IEMM0008_1342 [bacterium]
MDKDSLTNELKEFIIDTLDIDDVNPEELDNDKSLVAEDIGLNSIDLLELTIAIEKKYNIKIGNAETAQKVFQSVNTMADYIIAHQN